MRSIKPLGHRGCHTDKSKIVSLSSGIEFVGFRNFYYFKLLKKRSIKNIESKIHSFNKEEIKLDKFKEVFFGWIAHSNQSNNYNLQIRLINLIKT